jgi:hypothetical protein
LASTPSRKRTETMLPERKKRVKWLPALDPRSGALYLHSTHPFALVLEMRVA